MCARRGDRSAIVLIGRGLRRGLNVLQANHLWVTEEVEQTGYFPGWGRGVHIEGAEGVTTQRLKGGTNKEEVVRTFWHQGAEATHTRRDRARAEVLEAEEGVTRKPADRSAEVLSGER